MPQNSIWQKRKLNTTYLIAEIGVNHETKIEKAKLMIEQVKSCGWDCVKFQTYKADSIAQVNSPAYWDTTKEKSLSQHELFSKYDKFTIETYIKLAEFAKSVHIDFCTTLFNEQFVNDYDHLLPFYKIASADLTNYLLIDQILETGKDIILSTGASTIDEICRTVQYIQKNKKNSSRLCLLHCVLNYPTLYQNADLIKINLLKDLFPDIEIGYSDHVPPDEDNLCLITAYLLGAKIIEKHFTYDKSLTGNDHYHAYDKNDAKAFKNKTIRIDQLMGEKNRDVTKNQKDARSQARRSLVARQDIQIGEKLSVRNVTALRPCNGLSPEIWPQIKGKRSKNCIRKNALITINDF